MDERCGVALVCKGSFWQLFDLTGFKWLDLFARGKKKNLLLFDDTHIKHNEVSFK